MAFKHKGAKMGRGTVKGRLRILSGPTASEFARVNTGDIVVVKCPVPEYSMILHRVAAVIADKGGVGCHLAKLMREFNKLGWFGVGTATKVLNDGEMFTLNCP
jgi:phosphohistidine swiveling domain-containing protein